MKIEKIGSQTGVIRIPLSQGFFATIDAVDLPLVEGGKWSAMVQRRRDGSIRAVYAQRKQIVDGFQRLVRMHRLIACAPSEMAVDHIDGDGLNNRRENLRVVTTAQNAHNTKPHANTLTGLKGVAFDKRRGVWIARIMANGLRHDLGRFNSPQSAHEAYCEASAKLHGEFGRTT